jgi:uncharacterized protein (TIGR03437 family)
MLKYCALLSLCAGVGLGANFLTGQGARLVIGQPTFTAQLPGASDTLLGSLSGIAFAGDTLFVADSNRIGLTPVNNRVLLFQNVSQTLPQPLSAIPPYSGSCPVCVGTASLVLGQPDFLSTNFHISQSGLRDAVAVASDGRVLAVADTENNRVLIWNSIPTVNGQPADVVLGQPDFTTVQPVVATASSFRGPQGVWIQSGKLFVADTQNNRVLIWNSIPTTNNQKADVVLGQPDFTTTTDQSTINPTSTTMLDPVSVTSDGVRVYVADLGYDRVLIWNSIPSSNNQAADVVLGQKDFKTAIANDTSEVCPTAGNDSSGNPIYPARCGKSMDSPRFALSDGTRLFVADGGNDRVLIYNTIPTQSTTEADAVLGQPDEYASVVTSTTDLFHPLLNQSAANITPTPTSLAWDGTNLYVADSSNRRILVFTPGDVELPITNVRNSASLESYATGQIDISGTIQANDTLTITINGTDYTYKVLSTDTTATIVQALADLINAAPGDPNVIAEADTTTNQLKLVARIGGPVGNNISYSATTSTNAMIFALTAGNNLTGGESASTLAPGSLASLFGNDLADTTASADPSQTLPVDLGGVEVYFDGIRAPLMFVSPTQINAQLPWELSDTNSTSAYVRIQHSDGTVSITNAVGVPVAPQNPGIFALNGQDPRMAMAYHSSSNATGTITVSGTIQAGDVGTITVAGHSYNYTVQSTDTLNTVRDALIDLIDSDPNSIVNAKAGGSFVRIILTAKVAGPEGDGIAMAGSSSNPDSTVTPTLSLGVTAAALCCANVAGAPVTQANPALPGETIAVYATGLGLVSTLDGTLIGPVDGTPYNGPQPNTPNAFVSSLAGGSTANVISAGLETGAIGIYQVLLELNPSLTPNSAAVLTISQDIYTSNVVTIPIGNPAGPAPPSTTSSTARPATAATPPRKLRRR